MQKVIAVLFFLFFSWQCFAQQATVKGKISATDKQELELAVIAVKGRAIGTQANQSGGYELSVPANENITVVVTFLGYKEKEVKLRLLPNEVKILNVELQPDNKTLETVNIRGKSDNDTREQVSITKIDPRITKELPSPFNEFNRVLATLPGVIQNNELSSTYSVRGGNYDENLVYVNGLEIYRPFLVSSGQQEGLSFVNPDLVDEIEFSSGGWQPKYGDKLSSVLSIQYKKPRSFAGSVSGGLTGGSVHLEAASKNKRVSYIVGSRYKNGRYVFNSTQLSGDYRPRFYDLQSYISVDLTKDADSTGTRTPKTSIGILTSFANNKYLVQPESKETTFGTINRPIRLFVGYDGQERMEYSTYQTGIDLKHQFSTKFLSQVILGGVYANEREFRDLEAGYRFCDVNRDPNSDQFNECVRAREVGSRLDHSRNVLKAKILSSEFRNSWYLDNKNEILFGLKLSYEQIEDELYEYSFSDSADFVNILGNLNSDINLNSYRYNAYAQHTYYIDSLKTITYGVRASYWTVNKQFTVSPRVQYSFILANNPNLSFKTAVGYYHQPPFYRELRDREGVLNTEVRAQQSIHFIAGNEYQFTKWGRPFKLVSEVYYKYLTNIIPYDQDNVRLRYFAKNNAKGYATGLDVRVNGEFVKGTESWFSLGILSTKEDILADSTFNFDNQGNISGKKPIGYIRRPTDQRVTLGIYFEDHIPNNPTLKMYLSLIYGTGLPFNPPGEEAFRGFFTSTRPYIRPDIGFSKLLTLNDPGSGKSNGLGLQSLWISLEVLNLIDKNNLVSYSYVKDVNNITYSIPNYLTGRVINLRFIARF